MQAPNIFFVPTADGSKTLYNKIIGENYHSINGALQEAMHVFVKGGLEYYHEEHKINNISILEVGFGTGLNFLLSSDYAFMHQLQLEYCGIEAFPLSKEIILETKYEQYLENKNIWNNFIHNYLNCYTSNTEIESSIHLQIVETELQSFDTNKKFDIIFFDAFAKARQAEMWTENSIAHACQFLKDKGIFVTYSVTGDLKRTLKSLGFSIQRPEGAAGKREMMRATLNQHNAL